MIKNSQQAQQDSDFHLHSSFTYWISRLASVMQDMFTRELAEYDVTWPQWMVLNVLHNNLAVTPAQIADNIGIDRSAITRLVDRLEKKAYLERQHDELDRRTVNILLTSLGRDLMSSLNDAARKHQDEFLSQLHNTEYRGLKGNIQKMLRAGGVETSTLWKHM